MISERGAFGHVTFYSTVARTQINYLLLTKSDRGLCKDCKVIPSKNLKTQQALCNGSSDQKEEEKEAINYKSHISFKEIVGII